MPRSLSELKKVHIQGKAKRVRVGSSGILLALDDVLVDGQKLTPRKEPPIKEKAVR